jgi:WD40 repeat protein
LKVWKLADNSLLKESKEYHQESVQCIAFAPDGRMITGGYDGLCQFWDGRTFEPGKSYPNYRGYITACAISPDGHWLVRGGSSLDFVPLDRPEQVERVADFGGAILGFAVAPDRKRFATGGLDRRLILWKVDEGITSKAALLDDWITGLDFCRDGRSIAAALANGKIEIFSTETLEREKSWAAHKGRVSGLASIEGKLVSAGGDGAVHLWDLDGKRLKSYDEKAPCRSLATRRSRFAVGTANGTVSVYDLASDSPIRHLRVRPLSVTALGFSRGGYRLMVGYFDGGLESFDTESWSVVHFRPGKGESVLSIDPNPSNDLIAVGYRDGYARLFDVVSLREGPTVQSQPALEVFSARWVLDDSSLALAGATNSVLFHRVKGDVEAWTEKVR